MLDASKSRAVRIATAIKESGLTHAQLAQRLGVTPGAVSQWASMRTAPSASRLDALAEVLHVSAWYLRTGVTESPLEIELYTKSDSGTIAGLVETSSFALSQKHFHLG